MRPVILIVVLQLVAASPVQQDADVGQVRGPGCVHQGRFYAPDARWTEDNGCLSCSCQGGQARCQAFMCQVTCDNPRRVPGECCPACDGQSVVTQAQTCPSLGNCTLRCTHGFVLDEAGCYACQCHKGAACTLECPAGYAQDAAGNELCECRCPAAETCSKRCTHGYRKDPAGCSLCACMPAAVETPPLVEEPAAAGCTDPAAGGGRHDDGEYWSDGCRGCYCSGGRTLCELASCRDDTSALRRMAELALCGEQALTLQAGCAGSCRCLHGRVLCEVAACPPAACANPAPPDAMGCCPTCPPAPAVPASPEPPPPAAPSCPGGQAHGTSWRLSDCTSCRCERGRTECFEQRCPTLQCDLQFTPRGLCCPICLGERGGHKSSEASAAAAPGGPQQVHAVHAGTCWWGNQSHAAAEEWLADECTRCQCDPGGSGSSTCTHVVCSGCTTQHGYCCPPCSDGAGGVTLLVTLLAVTALLVLGVLAVGYFVWHRHHRRQTLEIARVDALKPPSRAPAPYTTYKMIPTDRR